MELLHKNITDKIIRAFYNVYNELGFGFLEKVYERSMIIELRNMGLKCESQKKIDVFYRNKNVGDYYADILKLNWFSELYSQDVCHCESFFQPVPLFLRESNLLIIIPI